MLALSKLGALCLPLCALSAASYSQQLQQELVGNGKDSEGRQIVPVDLGFQLQNGSMQTLIAENETYPLKRASVLEVHCRTTGEELQFTLFAKPRADMFMLHRTSVVCPRPGVEARIQRSIQVDQTGLWFGLLELGAGEATSLVDSREHVMTHRALLAVSRSLQAVTEERPPRSTPRAAQGQGISSDLAECVREQKELQDRFAEAKLAGEHWRLNAAKKEADLERLSQTMKHLQVKLKNAQQKMKARRDQSEEKQALEAMLEVKSVELDHRRREAKWWSVASAVVAGSSALAFFTWKRHSKEDDLSMDAKKERRKLLRLLGRVKAQSDTTSPTREAEGQPDKLDSDAAEDPVFPHSVELEQRRHRCVQRLRIQCPGVQEADVTIKVIFNGAEVRIDRQESAGLPAVSWKHSFIFPTEDGNFAFADDETKLSHGVLELIFIYQDFVSRTFRFPEHFDMAYDD